MKIARMQYDHEGDLLAPHDHSLRMVAVLFDTPITVDAGHWHRIQVSGRTPEQLRARLGRAFAQLQALGEVAVWRNHHYVIDGVDGRPHEVVDLVYGVPLPADRTRVAAAIAARG